MIYFIHRYTEPQIQNLLQKIYRSMSDIYTDSGPFTEDYDYSIDLDTWGYLAIHSFISCNLVRNLKIKTRHNT